jgi:glycerol-3-phosphate acyltransferase PlsX
MGGDHAPGAPIAGALAAIRELGCDVRLVGPEAEVRRELERHLSSGKRASASNGQSPSSELPQIVDAPEVIGMEEHPVGAVRTKRRSSIVVGLDLIARGEADAFVTAGNTGAAMAAAVFGLKRIPGVDRPALATPFPTARGIRLLLDIGANADARPPNLVQFAVMGAVYAERVLGIPDPSVGLLSIGEEESKGNLLVQESHRQLRQAPIRFIGNVEGNDLPAGKADVVVTDGFTGNVVVKLCEGVVSTMLQVIRSEVQANPVSMVLAMGLRPVFRRVRRRVDYAEYGGAPLLGVDGVCIIAHGRSDARAIRNAIRVAGEAVRNSVVAHIREGLLEVGEAASEERSAAQTTSDADRTSARTAEGRAAPEPAPDPQPHR